jgi:hypothetical protein
MDPEGQQEVMSMFSTAIKGFRVSQCRMVSDLAFFYLLTSVLRHHEIDAAAQNQDV